MPALDEQLPLHREHLGTVFVALLNDPAQLAALGDAVHQPPYKAPPRAPVLGIKPRNCFIGDGEAIVVPRGVDELQMGPTLGIVIGQVGRRLRPGDAARVIAGYVVCNDVCVPHASHYRPALRHRCRDGFLPIGTSMLQVDDPDALDIVVRIDGKAVMHASTRGMQRGVTKLVADISGFMTLAPMDMLLLGVPFGAPRAHAGQTVSIQIERVGSLSNPLVAEGDA
jgi:5-oxopent-3-ene-1,2,5-tricarboxylate decarboxylase/2-hydroxyhepta-2,4-diene-1,7-dioate isomerase